MNKNILFTLFVALALVFTACGGKETPTEQPQVPTEPVAPPQPETQPESTQPEGTVTPEEATGDTEIVKPGSDVLSGEATEVGTKVDTVKCDFDKNSITFTFKNIGDRKWDLDQTQPFAPSKEVVNIRLFLNGRYEMNKNSVQYTSDFPGVPLFGPNAKFSDNCGGKAMIEMDETVTCTTYPVPLNIGTGTESLKKVNQIFIDTPSIDHTIEFVC